MDERTYMGFNTRLRASRNIILSLFLQSANDDRATCDRCWFHLVAHKYAHMWDCVTVANSVGWHRTKSVQKYVRRWLFPNVTREREWENKCKINGDSARVCVHNNSGISKTIFASLSVDKIKIRVNGFRFGKIIIYVFDSFNWMSIFNAIGLYLYVWVSQCNWLLSVFNTFS